jgi:hypothetical protein
MPAGCRLRARGLPLCRKANADCGAEVDELATGLNAPGALAALEAAAHHYFANILVVFR